MVVLNFILTPEAASKIHDVLVCLGKFSETVAIEARRDRVGECRTDTWHPFLCFFAVHNHQSEFIQVRICCCGA